MIIPTGYYVKAGHGVQVDYETTSSDPKIQPPILRIGNIDPFDPPFQGEKPEVVHLTIDQNFFKAEKDGILYAEFVGDPAEKHKHTIKLVDGRIPMPHFVLGTHTQEDWMDMLSKYKDAPYAELVGYRNLINVPFDSASQHVDNAPALMELLDKIVILEEQQNGINPGNAWPHHNPPQCYHHISVNSGRTWSGHHRMGYNQSGLNNVSIRTLYVLRGGLSGMN